MCVLFNRANHCCRGGLRTLLGIAFLGFTLALAQCKKEDDRREGSPAGLELAGANAGSQDMDMQVGADIQRNFAHQNLIILSPPQTPTPEFRAMLDGLYQHYSDLHEALVDQDQGRIDKLAAIMRDFVEEKRPAGLNGQGPAAWAGHRQVLRSSLHQISEETTLGAKRIHFSHLGEAMYCALKSFGGIGRPLYVLHCPMAFGQRGAYWLSSTLEVRNPYLSESMLACGDLQETIPDEEADRTLHSPHLEQSR